MFKDVLELIIKNGIKISVRNLKTDFEIVLKELKAGEDRKGKIFWVEHDYNGVRESICFFSDAVVNVDFKRGSDLVEPFAFIQVRPVVAILQQPEEFIKKCANCAYFNSLAERPCVNCKNESKHEFCAPKRKRKRKKEYKCPHGHKFGIELEGYDDCETCHLHNKCEDKYNEEVF